MLPLNYVDKQSIVVGFFFFFSFRYSILTWLLSRDKVVQLCVIVELHALQFLYVDTLYYWIKINNPLY